MTQVAPHSGRRAARDPERPSTGGATDPGFRPDPGADPGVNLLQEQVDDPRGRHATTYGQNFSGVVLWTLVGSLVPGTGLLAAGRRMLGGVVLCLSALLASAAVTYSLIGDPMDLALWAAARPDMLVMLTAVLTAMVLAWIGVVLGTHSALRRYAHLGTGQRVLAALLVTSLIALVALPTASAARYALIWRDTITTVTAGSGASKATGSRPNSVTADPWANTPRVNVLLIGSDAGADRTGIRPDTLIVASIDTRTGNTLLFSLPRNLERVPFPPNTPQAEQYPYGFYCNNTNGVNTECLLNAMWTFGEEHWKEYYPTAPTKFDAGLKATEDAVYQLTGLQIDQYAMVNLRGFMRLVDALGGVTVNISRDIPVGGHGEPGSGDYKAPTSYLKAGPNQLLNGYEALWFARSRQQSTDFDRMTRQRCVIGAVVAQADPVKVALAFPSIAAAAKDNIITDIPTSDLGAWVQLTQKVKKASVKSLPFTDRVINTSSPDIAKMRRLVQEALKAQSATPTAKPSAAATPSASPSTKPSTRPSPSASPVDESTAQDVTQVC